VKKDPLSGSRIILTREKEDNRSLKAALERRGALVIEIPAIVTVPMEPAGGEAVLSMWKEFGWTVFTSRKGVRFFAGWMKSKASGFPPNSKTAAVGKGTAECLSSIGIQADLVPLTEDGEHLGRELSSACRPSSALFPQAAGAVKSAQTILLKSGWTIVELELYETRPRSFGEGEISDVENGADLAFFASPSALSSFASDPRTLSALSKIVILPIGKTTSGKAADLNLETLPPPSDTSVESVLASMEDFFRSRMPY